MWTILLVIWCLWAIVTPLALTLLSGLLNIWTRGSVKLKLHRIWQDTKYGYWGDLKGRNDKETADNYMFTYLACDGFFGAGILAVLGVVMCIVGVIPVLILVALAPAIVFVPRAAVDVKNGRPLYTHPNTLLLEDNTAEMVAMKEKVDEMAATIAELKTQQENK